MRGAKWLAAVLCPLALLVARLWAFRLHPGQGKRAATKAAGAPWGCGGAGGGVGGGTGRGGGGGLSVERAGRLRVGSAARVPLCCPATLNPALSLTETLVKQLTSYEIVTPVRVNEFGEVFPHTRHFSRRKRSSEPAALRTHYRLSAYGQLFQLNLSADAGFIAAHFAALHVGAPQQPPSPDLRHCFYRGHVNAQQAHVAVLSVCGGLVSACAPRPHSSPS